MLLCQCLWAGRTRCTDAQRALGNLWARYTPNTPTPWYSNPLVAWILPLLGPVLASHWSLASLGTLPHSVSKAADHYQSGLGSVSNCSRETVISMTPLPYKKKRGSCGVVGCERKSDKVELRFEVRGTLKGL